MNTDQSAWLLLLLIGIMLIVIGVQGSLGTLVAIIFCPKYVEVEVEPDENEKGENL